MPPTSTFWQPITRSLLMLTVAIFAGCASTGPLRERAYVAPEKLRLRSTTAQAARQVAELRGSDAVTITDREDSEEGISWAEVIGPGGEKGWAEARFLIRAELVEEGRRIAESTRSIRTQAVGRSRASLKLRLTPDRSNEDNVGILLPAGSLLDIVARQRKPRPASRLAEAEAGEALTPPGDSSGPKSDDWFLVRVHDFSVVPAGWIYGGSVSLEIPPEIIYFASPGRRITGWHKIGTVTEEDGRTGDHYLVLEMQTADNNSDLDFDRVKVLAYDPVTRNYTTPFREDLRGRYPVTLEMNGSRGRFQLTANDKVEHGGASQELSYQVELSESARIRVTRLTPPPRQ